MNTYYTHCTPLTCLSHSRGHLQEEAETRGMYIVCIIYFHTLMCIFLFWYHI